MKSQNAKAKALEMMKQGGKSIIKKGKTLAKMEKNDEGKTRIGNYSSVPPLSK